MFGCTPASHFETSLGFCLQHWREGQALPDAVPLREFMFARFRLFAVLFFCTIACGGSARAYSLLTHEQLIDLNWQRSIVPLLLSRYPTLTPAQLAMLLEGIDWRAPIRTDRPSAAA